MNNDAQTKKEFAVMVSAIWSVYGVEVSKSVMSIYFNALIRYEIEDIRRAFNLHIQNTDGGQYLPKPADLIRTLEGTQASKALTAWSKVEKAIRTLGVYRTVVFDDPVIHAVIDDLGGWVKLNEITESELPFKRNEFEKRYQAFSLQGGAKEFKPRLIGLTDSDRQRRGLELSEPCLVGDPQKAAQVFKLGTDFSGLSITTGNKAAEIIGRLDSLADIKRLSRSPCDGIQEK